MTYLTVWAKKIWCYSAAKVDDWLDLVFRSLYRSWWREEQRSEVDDGISSAIYKIPHPSEYDLRRLGSIIANKQKCSPCIACLLQKLILTERLGNIKVDQDVSSDSWLDQFNPTLSAPHQTTNELKEIDGANSTSAESNVGNQEGGQNAAVINSVQLAEMDRKIAKLLAELEELKESRAQLIALSSVGTTT